MNTCKKEWRENTNEIMRMMFEAMPEDKKQTFNNAVYRNYLLTSNYELAHGSMEVYKEGWYIRFTGCRSEFAYWCFDNDGEMKPGRKPNKEKLNYLWGFEWYNEDEICEMCRKAAGLIR